MKKIMLLIITLLINCKIYGAEMPQFQQQNAGRALVLLTTVPTASFQPVPHIKSSMIPFRDSFISIERCLGIEKGQLPFFYNLNPGEQKNGQYFSPYVMLDISNISCAQFLVLNTLLSVPCFFDERLGHKPCIFLYKQQFRGNSSIYDMILSATLIGDVPTSGHFISNNDREGADYFVEKIFFSSIFINNSNYFIPTIKLYKNNCEYFAPCAFGINNGSLLFFPY